MLRTCARFARSLARAARLTFASAVGTRAPPECREQSAWCLGNIAGDGPAFRDLILSTPGAAEALLLNIQHPHNDSMLKNCTWTLSNFCRGKPLPPLERVRPLIPALVHLLNSPDADIITDAAWGLSYLSDGEDARIQAVVDSGVVTRLVQLLAHPASTGTHQHPLCSRHAVSAIAHVRSRVCPASALHVPCVTAGASGVCVRLQWLFLPFGRWATSSLAATCRRRAWWTLAACSTSPCC